MAIFLREPGWEGLDAALRTDRVLIGAPTLFELRRVLASRGLPDAARLVADLVAAGVVVHPFGLQEYRFSELAYERYGKGRGGGIEASVLDLFDCMTYGTARAASAPLLFKGDDFAVTDLGLHPACQDGHGAPLAAL